MPSAYCSESPTTSGTLTGAGPPLTTSCTELLGGTTMSGGGSCQTTAPRGTTGLVRSPSIRTRKPRLVESLPGVRLRQLEHPRYRVLRREDGVGRDPVAGERISQKRHRGDDAEIAAEPVPGLALVLAGLDRVVGLVAPARVTAEAGRRVPPDSHARLSRAA